MDNLLDWFFWFLAAYVTIRVYKAALIIAKSVIAHLILPPYSLDHLKDSWTVCTGATDGIGKAYITELAKTRGIRKFFLIGRNADKLAVVQGELAKSFGAEVKTAIFDFANDDLNNLPTELTTLDIGILINCAGIAPNSVGTLTENEPGLGSKILKVNLMSPMKIIELVLPGMVKRNKGVIVNVSSYTCWRPMPYLSSYPGSKAALAFISDALADEYRNSDVKIQCLAPLFVAIKASSYEESEANEFLVVTTDNFARQAVRIIGRFHFITGCIQHDIQAAIGTLLGFFLFKLLYVPLVILGEHKGRVAAYQKRHNGIH